MLWKLCRWFFKNKDYVSMSVIHIAKSVRNRCVLESFHYYATQDGRS